MTTDTYTEQPMDEKRGGSGCLKGCLIFFAVVLVLSLIAGWWVSRNWRSMFSSMASQGINKMVDNSNLPAAEKEEVKAEASRITDGVADGSITAEQLERIMTGLVESPLMPLLMVKSVEAQYLEGSGLSDEEKAEAKVTLSRYARGLADNQYDKQAVDQVLQHIADKDASGAWQLRREVSDEQLREFLAAAKQQADDKEIPAEVEPIDPSDELKKVIDAVLVPAAAPLPAE